MPQHYDISGKKLIAQDPAAFCQLVGYKEEKCELLDTGATLSQLNADCVILMPEIQRAVHLEIQSTYDPSIGDRILQYNVPIHIRLQLEVDSVLILLRKEAHGPRITGVVNWDNLVFRYRVISLWELQEDDIMKLPIGILPLAPLCNIDLDNLSSLLERMSDRLLAEGLTKKESAEFWSATKILMGLRMSAEEAAKRLMEVIDMELFQDSSVYQEIVQIGEQRGMKIGEQKGMKIGEQKGMKIGEQKGMKIGEQKGMKIGEQKGKKIGEIEGSLAEARNLIILQGGIKYQPAPAPIIDKLHAMKSKADLENLAIKLLSANSWEELFEGIE